MLQFEEMIKHSRQVKMKKLLLIKCGDTIADLVERKGDFEDWIINGTGLPIEKTVTVNVEKNEPLPEPDTIAGVIISGSHAMVTEQRPWSERTAAWLRRSVGQVPVLGICYGHQLLGYALGGTVADNPNGREMGVIPITFTPAADDDPLLGDFTPAITAAVSHKQSLVKLPPGALHLASSQRESYQAFRYGNKTWGLQFHPEFDAEITSAYVDYCQEALVAEGQDPAAIRRSCVDTPTGPAILRRFADILSKC
jgi:GMP synthase (glutamine-hydrolysing)